MVVPMASNAATVAPMARPTSNPPTVGRAGGGGGRCCMGFGPAAATGAAPTRGAAAAAGAAAAGGGGVGGIPGAPAEGPPGGKVGSLIVGAAEGLGGRLMRTVSFLGWTLEGSPGLGGSAPPGKLGFISAICCYYVYRQK